MMTIGCYMHIGGRGKPGGEGNRITGISARLLKIKGRAWLAL
jgi:hypothetical protein